LLVVTYKGLKFLYWSNLLLTVSFPFVGRFDNGGDLRNAVDHRHSPSYWRRSPGRDERGHDCYNENGSPHHDRGHTQSKSPAKRRRSVSHSPQKSPEYKKRDTKKHLDTTEPHLSDVSGPEDVAVDEANGKAGSQSISTSSQEALEEQVCSIITRPILSSFDTATIQ
jgi:hypothetical protein